MIAPLAPTWRTREPPLPPAAVAAGPGASAALAASVARRLTAGSWLRACAADGWLIVLGDAADLPWADGARYLGWESGVLLPTTAAVTPGPYVLRRAIGAAATDLVAVLPDAVLVAPMPQRRADPRAFA